MAEAKKTTKKAAPKAKKAPSKASKKPQEGAYAVFATGGKQYLVYPGQTLKIEKIKGEHKEGDTITFDNVLLSGTENDTTLGDPFIKGSAVSATLKKIGRYKTIDVIRYQQKSRRFRKYGHRQPYFEVVIDSIK